jgi:hypothetical protein
MEPHKEEWRHGTRVPKAHLVLFLITCAVSAAVIAALVHHAGLTR